MINCTNATVSLQQGEQDLTRIGPIEDECLCPGDVITYECTAGENATNVVWKGSALNCSSTDNAIILPLRGQNNTSRVGTCNNDTISGKIVRIDKNGIFTSQLNVTLTDEVIEKDIECAYDDGITEVPMGSLNISDGEL